jgi:uncharacterized membrane protein YdbT with pleckstrin-like domain
MAGNYLQSLLGDRENIILTTRHHWFILASSIILEIFFIDFLRNPVRINRISQYSITALFLSHWVFFIAPIAIGTRDVLNWTNHQFIITNRRVMQISGVINKSIIDSSLEKVNDIKMEISALGRVFDYGDIEILTASELGVNKFKQIENPVRFKTALLNAKATEQTVAIPIEGI